MAAGSFSFPPITDPSGRDRLPNITEREVIIGFPSSSGAASCGEAPEPGESERQRHHDSSSVRRDLALPSFARELACLPLELEDHHWLALDCAYHSQVANHAEEDLSFEIHSYDR